MVAKIIDATVDINDKDLNSVVAAIENGKLVVFPTETVYGLGAIANNDIALKNIYLAKGRPSDNPLILHIYSKEDFYRYSKQNDKLLDFLLDHFTPGPITFIVKSQDSISKVVTAGLNTVAIRIPSHKIARKILKNCSYAIAAPSANISGKPSATTNKYAYEDLKYSVEFCVDGNEAEIGVESTILDLTTSPPVILRPGKITAKEINDKLKQAGIKTEVVYNDNVNNSNLDAFDLVPKAPGMKYRHYAPNTKVVKLTCTNLDRQLREIERYILNNNIYPNDKISILCSEKLYSEVLKAFPSYQWEAIISNKYNDVYLAKHLFESFRKLDINNSRVIFVEAVENKNLGIAVMNRLNKACGDK